MAKTRPAIRLRIDLTAECAIGPGKIGLLEAIDRTGSLSAAARELGMSYRRGWLLLHSINDSFLDAAVELSAGGKDGGGTRLTAFGRELIRIYRDCEAQASAYAAAAFAEIKVRKPAPAGGATAESPASVPRRSISRSSGSVSANKPSDS